MKNERKGIVGYLVVDCKFNRYWYPTLTGKVFYPAPSYARVRPMFADECSMMAEDRRNEIGED